MIFIGADHGGYEMKELVMEFLKELGEDFKDLGTYSAESCDYPDIAKLVSENVVKYKAKGILICGSGIGMSIAANKINGVRCALCHDAYSSEYSRRHNDANIIAFGGRTTGLEIAKQMVKIFLNTEFESGRHKRRVDKIDKLEEL